MEYRSVKGGFLLRLHRNEKVTETILNFIKEKEIAGGVINGIGAIEKVTLGYYNPNEKKYHHGEFNGIYEVVSFMGNISYVKEEPFIHAHIVLGDSEFQSHAGHFFEATVAATLEIFIRSFEAKLQREMDDSLGLNLLKLG